MKTFSLLLICMLLLGTALFLGDQTFVSAGILDREAAASTVYLPLVPKNYALSGTGYGKLTGTVRDIRTKEKLPGIEVRLEDEDTIPPVITDSDGKYEFLHLLNGDYTVLATDSSGAYVQGYENVTVVPNRTVEQDIELFPTLGDDDVRVVVTWDSQPTFEGLPNDMNLHLWIYDPQDPEGTAHEISISDTGNCVDIELPPQACYEQNEQYGSGPDVIVFKALSDAYSIGVLNYYGDRSDFPDFKDMVARNNTPAHVAIYKGGTLLYDEMVTNATGSGDFWYILKYDEKSYNQNCIMTYPNTGAPPPDACVVKMLKK